MPPSPETRPPFLSGTWRDVVMVTWVVDPGMIRPFVPTGTEMDLFKGDALVTLSAIDIQDARLCGHRLPWHRRFPALSLQCYVRYRAADGTTHRGITLIRSMVSRRLVAFAANMCVREQLHTYRMRRAAVPETPPDLIADDTQRSLVYEWRRGGEWERIIALTVGAPRPPRRDSVEAFVTDRSWRFARPRTQPTVAIRVDHAPWNISLLADCLIEVDLASLFGPHFTDAMSVEPISTLAAEGSPVDVSYASPLDTL